MAISFEQIPSNLRVPGVFVEFNNTRANTGLAQLNRRILVIGQRLSTGTVAQGTPTLVPSYTQAVQFFGRGSNLANLFELLFKNNNFTEKWAVALDDNGAGVAASGSIVVAAPATESGTITLYIGGVRVQVAVSSGDTAATIAMAINTAINANLDLPVTATVSTSTVSVTARHKGTLGNQIDILPNFGGVLAGEKTPAGVTLTINALTGGLTDPAVATAIAGLDDKIYNDWLVPYTDSTNLTTLETELTARNGAMRMLEGVAISAYRGSLSTVSTFGMTRNKGQLCVVNGLFKAPQPAYLINAAAIGQIAFAAANDPARPFNGLELIGILPPAPENRPDINDNNSLLYSGIATLDVTPEGKVVLQRLITTYKTNPLGIIDGSYLDANTLYTLSFLRQTLRARISQKFPRHKLANDGTKAGAGQAIVTPKIVKAEIIALAGLWEEVGVVEDLEQFARETIVERNVADPNRLDVILPPNLVNQLQVLAFQIQFIV